jgi:chitodextrinase
MKLQLRMIVWFGSIALLGMFSRAASADSIALRNGQHLQGKFAGGTQGVIAFVVAGATQYYNVKDVLVMTFEEETDTQGNYAQPQPQSGIPKADTLLPQSQKTHRKPQSSSVKLIAQTR